MIIVEVLSKLIHKIF